MGLFKSNEKKDEGCLKESLHTNQINLDKPRGYLEAKMATRVVSFKSAVRGFHVYRNCWNPQENEVLNCFHESNNQFDMFAIQVCQQETNKRVGHLPIEISRITKFLIERGARIQATLTSTHYRRSPFVRGGLEIPCEITVQITNGDHRKELLERYEILLNDLYLEPVIDDVVG